MANSFVTNYSFLQNASFGYHRLHGSASTVLTAATTWRYITLKTIYSGLSNSNFKDHYGDVVITQCLDKIAKINEIGQVAQLSQRDHAVGWVSYGQKWKTGTGRQYFADIIGPPLTVLT